MLTTLKENRANFLPVITWKCRKIVYHGLFLAPFLLPLGIRHVLYQPRSLGPLSCSERALGTRLALNNMFNIFCDCISNLISRVFSLPLGPWGRWLLPFAPVLFFPVPSPPLPHFSGAYCSFVFLSIATKIRK